MGMGRNIGRKLWLRPEISPPHHYHHLQLVIDIKSKTKNLQEQNPK